MIARKLIRFEMVRVDGKLVYSKSFQSYTHPAPATIARGGSATQPSLWLFAFAKVLRFARL